MKIWLDLDLNIAGFMVGSNLDKTYVVFNIMSFAGKPLVKISFGPFQSYF